MRRLGPRRLDHRPRFGFHDCFGFALEALDVVGFDDAFGLQARDVQSDRIARGPVRVELAVRIAVARRFAEDMDRMFEDFAFPSLGRFSPKIDIFERDGKLVVRADLPGMSKEDVTVDITEDAVVIEGERKFEHEENQEGGQ